MLLSLLACDDEPVDLSKGRFDPSCAPVAERVDPARLRASVEHLATPRRTPAARAEARAWLVDQLQQGGLTPQELPFSIAGVDGVNLLVPGNGLVVGAHYDTVADTPGADDNASGVAVVLEAARVLGEGPTWVFFDAEEPFGLPVGDDARNFAYGSQAFVNVATRATGALIVESVGYGCDGCQRLPPGVPPGAAPQDGRGIYLVGNTASGALHADALAVFGQVMRERRAHPFSVPGKGGLLPQSRFSDHAPFWDAGIPALMITDTALLRNPAYHEEEDTAERLDWTLLGEVARATTALVAQSVGVCASTGPRPSGSSGAPAETP